MRRLLFWVEALETVMVSLAGAIGAMLLFFAVRWWPNYPSPNEAWIAGSVLLVGFFVVRAIDRTTAALRDGSGEGA